HRLPQHPVGLRSPDRRPRPGRPTPTAGPRDQPAPAPLSLAVLNRCRGPLAGHPLWPGRRRGPTAPSLPPSRWRTGTSRRAPVPVPARSPRFPGLGQGHRVVDVEGGGVGGGDAVGAGDEPRGWGARSRVVGHGGRRFTAEGGPIPAGIGPTRPRREERPEQSVRPGSLA